MSVCKDVFNNVERNMWLSIEHTMLPAAAYAMLAASSLWSIFLYTLSLWRISFGFLTFGLFLANGIFGVWHYVNIYKRQVSLTIHTCFKFSKFLSILFGLPIIVSDLYINYNFSFELVCAHLILPLLALVPYSPNVPADKTLLHLKRTYYPQKKVRETLDFVIFCNVVSLTIVSILGADLFGVLAAFVYAIAHFIVTEEGYVEIMKMPAESIYTSGMGLFCLLGMRAMMAAQ